MGALQQFLKLSKSKPEIYPLFIIMGGALTGAVYMGTHAAMGPDVVWNHGSNAHPWEDIKDGEQVKLMALHQKYDHRWSRKAW